MKIFVAAMLAAAMLCGVASADDKWSKLTDWSKWYSEEDQSFTCPQDGYLAMIWCAGDSCDNKRYRCRTGFEKTGKETLSGWQSEENDIWNCPAGWYVDQVACQGRYCDDVQVRCSEMKPIAGVKPGACRESGGISEEGGEKDSQGREVGANIAHAATNQLFGGFHCTGGYCDNLYMQYCDLAEGGTIPLNDFGWVRLTSISGGTISNTYTLGRDGSSETSNTFGASLTIGVSQEGGTNVGIASTNTTISAEVTASYEHGMSRSEGWNESHEWAMNCDQTASKRDHLIVYVYSLLNRDAGVTSKTKNYRCHYAATSESSTPMCMPDECDERLAANCQKCIEGKKPIASSLGRVVQTRRTGKKVLGLFVEYQGEWEWANSPGSRHDSVLVLYNGQPGPQDGTHIGAAPEQFLSYCYESNCWDRAYRFDGYGDEAEVSFTIPNGGFFKFKTTDTPGHWTAEYWDNEGQSRNSPAKATAKFRHHTY